MIFLNKSLNLIILKKKNKINIFFFNKDIFVYFIKRKKKENELNNIYLNRKLNFIKLYSHENIIINLVEKIYLFFIEKLKFDGKGFKLKKIKNVNIFNFNNSHLKILKENKMKILKNNKNSFLIINKNKNQFLSTSIIFLKNLFKINIFTKKGIRIAREFIKIKKIKKK